MKFNLFFPGAFARSKDLFRIENMCKSKNRKYYIADSVFHLSNRYDHEFKLSKYYSEISDLIFSSNCKKLQIIGNSAGSFEGILLLKSLLEQIKKQKSNELKEIIFTHISPLLFEPPLSDSLLFMKTVKGSYNYFTRRNIDDYDCLISSLLIENRENKKEYITNINDTKEQKEKRLKLLYSFLSNTEIEALRKLSRQLTDNSISNQDFKNRTYKIIVAKINSLYHMDNQKEKASFFNFLKYLTSIIGISREMKSFLNIGGLSIYKNILDELKKNNILTNSNFVFVDRDIWVDKADHDIYIQNIKRTYSNYKFNLFFLPNTTHSSIDYFPESFENFF